MQVELSPGAADGCSGMGGGPGGAWGGGPCAGRDTNNRTGHQVSVACEAILYPYADACRSAAASTDASASTCDKPEKCEWTSSCCRAWRVWLVHDASVLTARPLPRELQQAAQAHTCWISCQPLPALLMPDIHMGATSMAGVTRLTLSLACPSVQAMDLVPIARRMTS